MRDSKEKSAMQRFHSRYAATITGSVQTNKSGRACKHYAWQKSEDPLSPEKRDPRRFPWGFCAKTVESCDDMYFWFRSLHELLTFIAEVPPETSIEDDQEHIEYTAEQIAQTAEQVAEDIAEVKQQLVSTLLSVRDRILSRNRVRFAEVELAFDSLLGDYLKLVWVGTLSDLCNNSSQCCLTVREEFESCRDLREVSESGKVLDQAGWKRLIAGRVCRNGIPKKLVPEFIKYLQPC
jgi:hypothetical protein